jgi:putative DNA primase/helicase
MADFARWVVAAEPELGWRAGAFLDAYAGKQAAAHELTLEASAIAPFIRALGAEGFRGTATLLLERLNARLADLDAEDAKELRRNGWPKDARRLSGALRRIAPDLRAVGLRVEFHENKRPRLIELADEAASDAADAADAVFPTHSRDEA